MKIRFQADNDLHEDIVRSTKRLGPIDFRRAPDLGLHTGIKDPEVFRLCAEQNRILVTHDRRTMPIHFGEFIKGGGFARRFHRFEKTLDCCCRRVACALLDSH